MGLYDGTIAIYNVRNTADEPVLTNRYVTQTTEQHSVVHTRCGQLYILHRLLKNFVGVLKPNFISMRCTGVDVYVSCLLTKARIYTWTATNRKCCYGDMVAMTMGAGYWLSLPIIFHLI